jgi:hypothetical protein
MPPPNHRPLPLAKIFASNLPLTSTTRELAIIKIFVQIQRINLVPWQIGQPREKS